MNSKRRMQRALSGNQPDRVPAAPSYLNLFLEPYMGRYYLEQYRRRVGQQKEFPIDHREDTLFRANALYQSRGVFEETFDWMSVLGVGSSYEWASNYHVERTAEDYAFVDNHDGQSLPFGEALQIVTSPEIGPWGWHSKVPGHQSADERHSIWDRSSNFKTVSDVDAAIPIVSAEELESQGVLELPRQIAQDYGHRTFLYTSVVAPFSNSYWVVGFAGCMMMIYDRPDLLHRIVERKLGETIEYLKAMARLGIHGIWIVESRASADIISPKHFANFALPYLKILITEAKSLGLATILYFCGDAVPRIPSVLTTGVDAIALEESKKKFVIDIEQVVDEVGDRACVFGNINAIEIMDRGNAVAIDREVKRQIEAGKRARSFVASFGSPLPPTTNPRNVDAFARAVRHYGQLGR